jgi:hypothetical protein
MRGRPTGSFADWRGLTKADREIHDAIVGYMDENQPGAWPSVETLMSKTGYGRRTVQRCRAKLRTHDWKAVTRWRRNGSQASSIYMCPWGWRRLPRAHPASHRTPDYTPPEPGMTPPELRNPSSSGRALRRPSLGRASPRGRRGSPVVAALQSVTRCDRRTAHGVEGRLRQSRRGRGCPSDVLAEDVRLVAGWCRIRFRHFGPWAIVKHFERALHELEQEQRKFMARQLDSGQRVFA